MMIKAASKKERKGIALAFALVLLSLLLVIGVSFIISTANERVISTAGNNDASARMLAMSAAARGRLMLTTENNERSYPSQTGTNDYYKPLPPVFFSKTPQTTINQLPPPEGTAEDPRYEGLDDLLIKGSYLRTLDETAGGPEWLYITTPVDYGNTYMNEFIQSDEMRLAGRIAFMGFSGAKISLETLIDSRWKADQDIPRVGFSTRELQPGAPLGQNGNTILEPLSPLKRNYLSIGGNTTNHWPDMEAVASILGVKTQKDIMSLYQYYGIGKLPAPEMWRDQNGTAFHRFNLRKTADRWANFDIEKMFELKEDDYKWVVKQGEEYKENWTPFKEGGSSSGIDDKIGLYFLINGTTDGSLEPGGANPGQMTRNQILRQIMANIKDYNDEDVESTVALNSSSANEFGGYAGLEKVPYVNDLRMRFSYNARDDGSGSKEVSFGFDNLAIEFGNWYNHPELNLTEVTYLIEMDAQVIIDGSQKMDFSGMFPVTGVNFESMEKDRWGKPQSNGLVRDATNPYFIFDAGKGIGVVEETKTLSGDCNLNELRFRKLIISVYGKGTVNGKPLGKTSTSGYGTLLTVARPMAKGGNLFGSGSTLSVNGKGGNTKLHFYFDNDDPRAGFLSDGKDDQGSCYWAPYQEGAGGYWTNAKSINGCCRLRFGKGSSYNVGGTNNTKSYTAIAEEQIMIDNEPQALPSNAGPVQGSAKGHPQLLMSAFMRNAPMVSPWELGFIHRCYPWQTLNLTRYNSKAGEVNKFKHGRQGYYDGDAAILDQIKMSDNTVSYGRININNASDNVLTALFDKLRLGSSPAAHPGPVPEIKDADIGQQTNPDVGISADDPLVYGGREVRATPENNPFQNLLRSYSKKGAVRNWYSRAQIVNALFAKPSLDGSGDVFPSIKVGTFITQLYAGKEYKYGGSLGADVQTQEISKDDINQIPKALREEVLGKIIGLTEAESAREAVVIAVAQVIQDAKNKNGKYGYYESGSDKIVGTAKVMVFLEYWPKLTVPKTKAHETGMQDEFKRSEWVVKRIVWLNPAQGGVQ